MRLYRCTGHQFSNDIKLLYCRTCYITTRYSGYCTVVYVITIASLSAGYTVVQVIITASLSGYIVV